MDMPDLFGGSAPAPVLPLPIPMMQQAAAPTPAPPPEPAAPAPAGAPPKKPRKPVDPNKPKKPRKRKEAPTAEGAAGEPPAKKPRKKKEPELDANGNPIPKPKKPRKKKDPAAGADGETKVGSGAVKTEDDELGGDVDDDELIAASTVKRKKGDGEDDDEEEDDAGDDEEGGSADESEQSLQLGELAEATQDLDLFGDQYHALTEEEQAAFDREREKVTHMINNFTPEQMERYEAFRRSRLAAPAVRKLMNSTLGFSVHHDCGIVMAGAAKLFVGELIETARQVQEQWSLARGIRGPYGPLTPDCIREAYRRLKDGGKVPYVNPKRLFKRRRVHRATGAPYLDSANLKVYTFGNSMQLGKGNDAPRLEVASEHTKFWLHSRSKFVASQTMLSRVFVYGLGSVVATTAVAGYSLTTGQLPTVNNFTLHAAAFAFNSCQNKMQVNFGEAYLCLKTGEFRAEKLVARRINHRKSNFDIMADFLSVRSAEPFLQLLRSDVKEYLASKDHILSSVNFSGCHINFEIVKEKDPKTPAEKRAKAEKKHKRDIIFKELRLSDVTVEVFDRRFSEQWRPWRTVKKSSR